MFLPIRFTMKSAMRCPSPVRSYPSARMNAPNMSHTVGLLYPESAQVRAALAGRNPGADNCWGLNSVKRASTVTRVRPIIAMAAPGNGSRTSPIITPAKIEKYNHAKCGKPGRCWKEGQNRHDGDRRNHLPYADVRLRRGGVRPVAVAPASGRPVMLFSCVAIGSLPQYLISSHPVQ